MEYLPFRDHTLSLLSEVIQTSAWQADCSPVEAGLLELCQAKDQSNSSERTGSTTQHSSRAHYLCAAAIASE